MEKELLDKIRNAYESESPELGSLLKEAGFSENELNQLRDAYESMDDKTFGSIVTKGPIPVREKSEREKLGMTREEFGKYVAEQEKAKAPSAADIKEEERRLQQLAGFPRFTKSFEADEPFYKTIGYLLGDIMSAPGRVLRADLITPDNTSEEFLRRMAEVEPTSEGTGTRLVEGMLQSPSLLPLIGTAPVSMPALIGTGVLGGVSDVAYGDEDAEASDYLIAGGTGGALGPAGKIGAKVAKKAVQKVLPEVPAIREGVTDVLTEGIPKVKKTPLQLSLIKPNEPRGFEQWLYQKGYDITKLTKKQIKNLKEKFDESTLGEVAQYLPLEETYMRLGRKLDPFTDVPKERIYDVMSRPVGIELGDIMSQINNQEE
jgi:hypothetical protein